MFDDEGFVYSIYATVTATVHIHREFGKEATNREELISECKELVEEFLGDCEYEDGLDDMFIDRIESITIEPDEERLNYPIEVTFTQTEEKED